MTDRVCWERHVAPWAMEPRRFLELFAAYKSGDLPMKSWPEAPPGASPQPAKAQYEVTPDGVGIVRLAGIMEKGPSKFADTDTIGVRKQLRSMAADERVSGIFVHIDSPGGMAAGTDELAGEIRKAAEKKPLTAHIEDLGASAAYWAASQAPRITATRTSEVGSIGTLAVLYDESKRFEVEGLKPVVLTTADLKTVGIPGLPITDEQQSYLQGRVQDMNAFFLQAVKAGRNATAEQMREWTTGAVWIASEAKRRGLVDAVASTEEALETFTSRANARRRSAAARAQIALAEVSWRKT